MFQPNPATIRQKLPPNGIIGERRPFRLWNSLNTQSLPPVPSSDTCGRLCIYIWMKTLRPLGSAAWLVQESRYLPKSLRLRGLWLVFVVCFIVFISIILNVAHHPIASEYTTLRCKANANREQNLPSLLEQLCRDAAFLLQRYEFSLIWASKCSGNYSYLWQFNVGTGFLPHFWMQI